MNTKQDEKSTFLYKNLVMDVLVGQVLKGLPSLHLTLWLLKDVCCTDDGFLLHSDRQWQDDLSVYTESLLVELERMGR